MARPVKTDEEQKPRKKRGENRAELLLGLAKQRKLERNLAEHYAKEIGDLDAYSIADFCRRHSISIQMFYKLLQQGLAPATFRLGARVLVSKEAAARWRADREAATTEAGAVEGKAAGTGDDRQPAGISTE